jgi:hypothetical protein
MKNKLFQERLDLINKARQKVATMQHKNAYVLDIEAMRLLDALSHELQSIVTENILLENNNRILLAKVESKRRSKVAKGLCSKSSGKKDR